MSKKFELVEVMRALGIAPSTANIVAGLMNGTIDPDNCRSVEFWPLADLDAPPQYRKVLIAIADLLGLECDDVKVVKDFEGSELWYVHGFGGQPTVTWFKGEFQLREVTM